MRPQETPIFDSVERAIPTVKELLRQSDLDAAKRDEVETLIAFVMVALERARSRMRRGVRDGD